MTDTSNMIALDEADYASLKAYAEVQLGLEVKNPSNSAQVRAKIRTVAPDLTHIPGKAAVAPAAAPVAPAPAAPAAPVAAEVVKYDLYNANLDPKVKIVVDKTADGMRARDVVVSVNDKVWQIKRGEEVNVPYRVYHALMIAIEKRAVFNGEVNSFGMPEYEYQDVMSYPFRVLEMPDKAEIERWHRETSGAELKAA